MDIKRLVIGTVAGGITLFVLGYVIWNMLFADFFAANAGMATDAAKDPQVMWAIAVGTLSYAVLLTLAIGTRPAAASVIEGAKIAGLVGFLMWFGADMIIFGVWNLSNLTAAIADSLLELVRAAISGAVIATVLAKIAA